MISFFGHTAMQSPQALHRSQFTSIFPIFRELQVDLNRKKGGGETPEKRPATQSSHPINLFHTF
jgi:hypothetical protein